MIQEEEEELDAEDEHRERTRDADDGEDVDDEEEQEVNNHLNELRRQALIESLIGMGFPVEWALRAAEHCDASVSESAAITWIIERMDVENSGKMDELEGDARYESCERRTHVQCYCATLSVPLLCPPNSG